MSIKMFPRFGWIETRRSKFGPIFSNKVQLSKYVNNKSCFHVFIFSYSSMEKIRNIRSADFDIENDFGNQKCSIFDHPFKIYPNT